MTISHFFLSQVDAFVGIHASQVLRFLWQSSILITGAWIVCRILDNDYPGIKRTLWTFVLLAVPVLPLISIMGEYQNQWDIAIEFDAGPYIGSIQNSEGVKVPENDPVMMQPVNTDENGKKSIMNFRNYAWATAVVVYFAGLCFMVAVFMVKIIRVHRWKKRGYALLAYPDFGNVCLLCRIKGRHRTIPVYRSDEVKIPMAAGVFRPVILVPSAHLERLEKKALDMVLAHEYAHIARHDNLLLMYASWVQIVLFFHPLVWFAVNRLALSMEEAADRAVLSATGTDSHEYASVLYTMAAFHPASSVVWPYSRNHNLLIRITNILNFTGKDSTMKTVRKFCLLAVTVSLLAVSLLVNVTCGTSSIAKESRRSQRIYMTVYGTVTDPRGNPVAGVVVDAVREVPDPYNFGSSLTGDCRFMTVTDSTGTFRFSFPEIVDQGRKTPFEKLVRHGAGRDGGIVLIAHAGNIWNHAPDHRWLPGLANGVSRPVKLVLGGSQGPVTIRLTDAVTISGKVIDKDSRPVPNRKVWVAYRDGHYDRYYRPTAVTDKSGRFTLSNVEPGKAWIVATDVLMVFSEASPYPENTLVALDIAENSVIDGLLLRGLSDSEVQTIRTSVPSWLRRKSFQIH